MKMDEVKTVLKCSVTFRLQTGLLLRSGKRGDFTDSVIEKTPDDRYVHIDGMVWASLLRRALGRVKGAEALARSVGKYEKAHEEGVSPFWFDASFIRLLRTDVRPGIRIGRKWGANTIGGLFSDEIVPPGYTVRLHFNVFGYQDPRAFDETTRHILSALWVINQGIETIGGGWSYGYGRLEVLEAQMGTLDLRQAAQQGHDQELQKGNPGGKAPGPRTYLWKDHCDRWTISKQGAELAEPEIAWPWSKIAVSAGLLDGQLLAIAGNVPPLDLSAYNPDNLPDAFLFRRTCISADGKSWEPEIVVTGKAIRQALLSLPIERKLKTAGEDICATPGEVCTCSRCLAHQEKSGRRHEKSPECECRRCAWFGSTNRRGLVSVGDAVIPDGHAEVISRIQLCEHSMQNMNLFAGEFLTRGTFRFDILVDEALDAESGAKLVGEIRSLLDEMTPKGGAPPGWYRVGGKTTCAGQIQVEDYQHLPHGSGGCR